MKKSVKIISSLLALTACFAFLSCNTDKGTEKEDEDKGMTEVKSADELLFADGTYDIVSIEKVTGEISSNNSSITTSFTSTEYSEMTVSGETCTITDKYTKSVYDNKDIYETFKNLYSNPDVSVDGTMSYDDKNLTITQTKTGSSSEKTLAKIKAEFFPEGTEYDTTKTEIVDSVAKQTSDGSKLKYSYTIKNYERTDKNSEWVYSNSDQTCTRTYTKK